MIQPHSSLFLRQLPTGEPLVHDALRGIKGQGPLPSELPCRSVNLHAPFTESPIPRNSLHSLKGRDN